MKIQESIPPCSLYLSMNPYPVPRYIPVSSARGEDSIALEIDNLIGLPETSAKKHFYQSIHKWHSKKIELFQLSQPVGSCIKCMKVKIVLKNYKWLQQLILLGADQEKKPETVWQFLPPKNPASSSTEKNSSRGRRGSDMPSVKRKSKGKR